MFQYTSLLIFIEEKKFIIEHEKTLTNKRIELKVQIYSNKVLVLLK